MAKEARFEDLMSDLEAIVGELEGGKLSLDQSLERYHKGVDLLKACYRTLDEMEKRIEILEKEGRAPEPFDPERAGEAGG